MNRIRTKSPTTVVVSGGSGPGLVDALSLRITAADIYSAPTDAATYALSLSQSDTYTGATEALKLGFPAPDFADTYTGAAEARSFVVRAWLSGSAGASVTSPANADGSNNATLATLQTAPAGAATITMTSNAGSGVPSGLTLTTVLYRGWFKSVNTLTTSSGTIKAHSASALFSDITMFSNAALNTTVDRLDGSFTYDLVAAGVNTLAKLQSLQVLHSVTDAAAGVSPHVLTVDAGAIEVQGAFT